MIRHTIPDITTPKYWDLKAISTINGYVAAISRQSSTEGAVRAFRTSTPEQSTRTKDLGISARRSIAPVRWPDETSCEAPPFMSDLLSAVRERLVYAANNVETSGSEDEKNAMAQSLATTVLECAADLGSLQTSRQGEIERLQSLRKDLFEANTALVQARSELAGTKAGEMNARYQSMHDSLTLLPNRDFFAKRLKVALTRAASMHESLAVMYLDLDGFKQVNDTQGHATGDEVLRIVGSRLSRLVRMEDMVRRLGGDEFGCLLTDMTSHDQLEHLAVKMLDAVEAPCSIGPITLSIRASIGIARCPTDGLNALTLLNHADAAMYFAKRRRTGHAFFDQCGGN